MRAMSSDRPRRARLSRGRIWLIVLAVVIIILIFSLRGIAGFYTDYLWFGSIHLTSVWSGVVGTKVALAAVFSAVFFVVIWLNLSFADRLAPTFRAAGPEDEFVQRYQRAVGPHVGKVRLGASLVLALLVGTGAAAQWNKWLLFRNSVPFHVQDPQFHKDIGFFVFRLPFYSWLVSWGFLAVVVITIVSVVAHYLNGGIRLQAPANRVTAHVKAHISVLLAALAVLKAIGYYLQRYNLDFSTRGVVNGALYTDIKAQLPALTLLMVISILAMGLFIYNIRRPGWTLPIIGVGLWAFVALIIGVVYPAIIQKFRVQPAENALERPYLQRNQTATRAAYGINNVQVTNYPYTANLQATDLTIDAQTVRNIRLWEPTFAAQTYQKLQEIRSYYQFPPGSLSIDRYSLNGQETQTLVAVRELNPSDLPEQGWVNTHLQYTHGWGAVLSPANAATTDGNPVFDIKDIPPATTAGSGAPTVAQPAVYFGVGINGFVIANTRQPEIDYQRPDGSNVTGHYAGTGGVQLSSFLKRVAFALRFGDINTLISGQITGQSRVMWVQDIQQRVAKAAPFLQLDADPYSAIVDGHIVWIQDAYTSTDHYPYSQLADTSILPSNSGLNINLNYVRNSVKVVTDAYTGNMTFYVVDPTDPIIQAYEKAFPSLFRPATEMSLQLRQHLRYPEDIFRLQTNTYGRYHITNVNDFYNAADAWNVAQSGGEGSPSASLQTLTTNPQGFVVAGSQKRMDPQYVEMRLPAAQNASFLLLQAMVPVSQGDKQQNLASFMVAQSDPSLYGTLQVFEMPPSETIDGPSLVDARIAADPTVSKAISLLNTQGSQVQLGNILVIPIQGSLIYVRPLYLESSRNPVPQLDAVIVVSGNQVSMESTLQQALTDIFGAAPQTQELRTGGSTATPTPPPTQQASALQNLLNQAAAAYAKAQADLKNGDLAAYQADITQMGQLIAQAGGNASSAPSGTTTTTAPAGPTTSSGSP